MGDGRSLWLGRCSWGLLGIDGGTAVRRISVGKAVSVMLHDDFWRGPQIAETDTIHPGGLEDLKCQKCSF